jgi:hypothetical protein
VDFTVRGLAATVRDGRLVALTGGSGEITATVSVEKKTFIHRKADAQLPLIVRLGAGVPLLPAGQPQPALAPPRANPDPTTADLVVHIPGRHGGAVRVDVEPEPLDERTG